MCPIKTTEFRNLSKVPSGPRGMKTKVEWKKFHEFLERNKEYSYSVKESLDFVNGNCMLNKGEVISRTRVYKELEKLVKKGKVEVRYDEAGTGYYNWLHLTPTPKPTTSKPTPTPKTE